MNAVASSVPAAPVSALVSTATSSAPAGELSLASSTLPADKPSAETEGELVWFESIASASAPAGSARKWTRYDVSCTSPGGLVRVMSTFHGSIGRALASLQGGERIRIWVIRRGNYQNIEKLALVDEPAAEESEAAATENPAEPRDAS